MQTVSVKLTASERAAAFSIGEKRQALCEQRGKSEPEYADRGGSHVVRNRIGCLAEYALAKHYGKQVLTDWCENKSFSLNHKSIPCDVGSDLHVRATTNARGNLIAHPYDPSPGVFVLAKIEYPELLTVLFCGWAWGYDIKQRLHWRDSGPGFGQPGRAAFVYPSVLLSPMSEIPRGAIELDKPKATA